MKSAITILGIILVIIGIIAVGYQGFNYTTREKVLEIGNVQVTADTEKHVNLPPYLGALCLVGGLVLIVVGRISKS